MTKESLERANATLRRGERVVLWFMAPGSLVILVFFLSRGFNRFQLSELFQHSLVTWLAILLIGGLCGWGILNNWRSTRVRLNVKGIMSAHKVGEFLWADITSADYYHQSLDFRDRHGRRLQLNLMLVDAHHVTEAVQDHLPDGVRLRVH